MQQNPTEISHELSEEEELIMSGQYQGYQDSCAKVQSRLFLLCKEMTNTVNNMLTFECRCRRSTQFSHVANTNVQNLVQKCAILFNKDFYLIGNIFKMFTLIYVTFGAA